LQLSGFLQALGKSLFSVIPSIHALRDRVVNEKWDTDYNSEGYYDHICCQTESKDRRYDNKEVDAGAPAAMIVSPTAFGPFQTESNTSNGSCEYKDDRCNNEEDQKEQESSQIQPKHSQCCICRVRAGKLLTRAAERIECLKVIRGVGTPTYPTKLELAIVAGHVVTTLTFFYVGLAHWAEANILTLGPFVELVV
jgi:hypothetical protein